MKSFAACFLFQSDISSCLNRTEHKSNGTQSRSPFRILQAKQIFVTFVPIKLQPVVNPYGRKPTKPHWQKLPNLVHFFLSFKIEHWVYKMDLQWVAKKNLAKLCSFSEHSYAILSSFKIMIIFNNTNADFVLIAADVLLKLS